MPPPSTMAHGHKPLKHWLVSSPGLWTSTISVCSTALSQRLSNRSVYLFTHTAPPLIISALQIRCSKIQTAFSLGFAKPKAQFSSSTGMMGVVLSTAIQCGCLKGSINQQKMQFS